MLSRIYEILVFVGARVVWDAVAAIGSIAAVFAALWLANRQSRDQRQQAAARIKALMTIIMPVADSAFEAANIAKALEVARYALETAGGEDDDGAEARKAKAVLEEVWARNRPASDTAIRALDQARSRLSEVDILGLPATAAITAVERSIAALDTSRDSLLDQASGYERSELVRALYNEMTVILDDLTDLAAHYGGVAERHDAAGLHNWLSRSILRLRRRRREDEKLAAWLETQKAELAAERARYEEREARMKELEAKMIELSAQIVGRAVGL
ncbi:MAG: hypothetical protein EON89_00360 [Brevundimonas sp.]|nr:MAG: hypothetical protein EON89_00360 [Brevundimonas sp.]